LVFKGCCYTKVTSTTSNTPEEILILCIAGFDELTIGSNNIDREQVITGQAIFARKPANSSA
jgi:hypothetical protein